MPAKNPVLFWRQVFKQQTLKHHRCGCLCEVKVSIFNCVKTELILPRAAEQTAKEKRSQFCKWQKNDIKRAFVNINQLCTVKNVSHKLFSVLIDLHQLACSPSSCWKVTSLSSLSVQRLHLAHLLSLPHPNFEFRRTKYFPLLFLVTAGAGAVRTH